jgi:hypothetical protein
VGNILTEFEEYAAGQLFGARYRAGIVGGIDSALLKVINANPSLTEAAVKAAVVSQLNSIISTVSTDLKIPSFALPILESWMDPPAEKWVDTEYPIILAKIKAGATA